MTRLRIRILLPLLVAVPLFPELFRLSSVTPFAQLVAFRPQGIATIGLIGAAALAKRSLRPPGAVLLALALIAAAITAPRVLSNPDEPPPGAPQLTVMAVNVLDGGADPKRIAEVIRSRGPAFVALPEAREDVRRQVEAELDGLGYRGYTVQSNESPVSATSVLVKAGLGDVSFAVDDTATTFGNVIVNGGPVRFVAYHSYPPLPGNTGPWKRDQSALKRWCGPAGTRTVVAGDFNASLDHTAFREGIKDCRNAAAETGEGLSGTWPAHRPAVFRTQIDHVVTTEDIVATGFTTYDIEGTDHRAVVATLALT